MRQYIADTSKFKVKIDWIPAELDVKSVEGWTVLPVSI